MHKNRLLAILRTEEGRTGVGCRSAVREKVGLGHKQLLAFAYGLVARYATTIPCARAGRIRASTGPAMSCQDSPSTNHRVRLVEAWIAPFCLFYLAESFFALCEYDCMYTWRDGVARSRTGIASLLAVV